jgi:hypothetical protein
MRSSRDADNKKDQARVDVYMLDMDKLLPGDIILTRSPGQFESAVIRAATWSNVSHAIMVVEPPYGIEAANSGVIRFRLDRFSARDPLNIKVLRVDPSHTYDQDILLKTADSLMGHAYADLGAFCSIAPLIPLVDRGRFFCSQLVAHCYNEAGFQLVPGLEPWKTTPEAIAVSPVCFVVADILKKVSLAELRFTPSYFDAPNEKSPNEKLEEALYAALQRITPIFARHGYEIFSRHDALMTLQRAFNEGKPETKELDSAIVDLYREAKVAEKVHSYMPADYDGFFVDLTTAHAILAGHVSREQAEQQALFYDRNLPTAEKTLSEREYFILVERAAFFVSGLEGMRQHLAAEWEVAVLHRKHIDAAKRARVLIELYLKNPAPFADLEDQYRHLLFGELGQSKKVDERPADRSR